MFKQLVSIMLKNYLYIYLLFHSFLYSTSIINSCNRTYTSYKEYVRVRDHIDIFVFCIEKFDRNQPHFKNCEENFLKLMREAKIILQRRELLKQLYLNSHDDHQSLFDLEHILQEDAPKMSEFFEELMTLKDKCN
jgi:hypothetical protein